MRGQADEQVPLFHGFRVEDRIRPDRPLRDVKRRVERILDGMSAQFAAADRRTGRPSVPPERLLKALLLMALDSVRSERQLCARTDTDLLFRRSLDLQPSAAVFDATSFTHNRQRLDDHDLTKTFFAAVVREALTAGLCSEPFSVDGTLIESFAAAKSFRPKGAADDGPKDDNGFQPRNVEVDFHGEKRTNDTHASRTDPEARLDRKGRGREAKLAHLGHTLGENRHGLIMAVAVTAANGTAERTAALDMLDGLKAAHGLRPKTRGADKGFADGEFFRAVEARQIEPHVPLVKEPRDPAAVPYHKRRPRGGGPAADESADGPGGRSAQSDVPQEDRGRLWLAEGDRRDGPESGGGAAEVAAVDGDRRRGLQPGATADADAGLRRRPNGRPAPGSRGKLKHRKSFKPRNGTVFQQPANQWLGETCRGDCRKSQLSGESIMNDLGFRAGPPTEPGRFSAFDKLHESPDTTVHIRVETKSGRVFRYDVSEYRFGPDLSPSQARWFARHIANAKYRPADWDWRHSREQAIEEISDSLFDIIMECVAYMRANASSASGGEQA